MKNVLIATVTAAAVLSTGAAFANSAGHNQFALPTVNTNVNSIGAANQGFNSKGHHQFNTQGFSSGANVKYNGSSRSRNSVAKEFAPWTATN